MKLRSLSKSKEIRYHLVTNLVTGEMALIRFKKNVAKYVGLSERTFLNRMPDGVNYMVVDDKFLIRKIFTYD